MPMPHAGSPAGRPDAKRGEPAAAGERSAALLATAVFVGVLVVGLFFVVLLCVLSLWCLRHGRGTWNWPGASG
ncbi:hypothetical protein [Streptomyces sp. NPDC005573]|uniref:hypothetical protein n=1 Tax=unclassified Streptomyces TaxID=2593676 RepID=UPI0033B84F4C